MHYCMGKLVGGSITLASVSDKHVCGKCGMKSDKKSKCCHDELTLLKVNDSHQPVGYFFESLIFDIPAQVFGVYHQPVFSFTSEQTSTNSSPPGKEHMSLHILQCNYRI
jgi:hypothetical protein